VQKAFHALDGDQQESYAAELRLLAAKFNWSGDQTLVVPSDYLEVVAVRA
jgi:hypothetical protein